MDGTRWGDGYGSMGTGPVPNAGQPMMEPPRTDPDNPFDEPEAAPELRQARSDSLYTRSAPFWERVYDDPREDGYPKDAEYWTHPEELVEEMSAGEKAMQPLRSLWSRLTSRTGLFFIGALVVILLAAVFCHSVFATVRTISVVGNERFTDEQIIALSGIEKGMSTLEIEVPRVMNSIAWQERYLRCTQVDVSFDKVTIHVHERQPACWMVQNGRLIVLDERGWVLEIYNDLTAPTQGLIAVQGLEVLESNRGQAVTLRMPSRLTVYTQILIELRALGGLDMITELDLTTMDSITLKTSDGLTILLGNESSIHEKIRAMQVVHGNLISNGFYGKAAGGTIVVSNPATPAYTPPY